MEGTRSLWLVVCSVLFLSACNLQQDVAQQSSVSTRTLDEPAPALADATLDGKSADLGGMHGHPVVVDFWASWCGPCHEEQPHLNDMYHRYHGRGVEFLGVDIRDDRASGQAFVREFSVPYPSIFDPSSTHAADFAVDAPPTLLVVDRRGHVRLRNTGSLDGITSLLDQLLARG